jgi:threonine aldolase
MAERFARLLEVADGVEVMHQELNQVVVRFNAAGGDDDGHTREVITKVQGQGTCHPSATVWRGRAAMRVSVSSWRTDEDDVDRSVGAILAAHAGS